MIPIRACAESLARAEAFGTAQEAWEHWPTEHLIDILNLIRIHPGGRTRLAGIAASLVREQLPVFEAGFPGDSRAREILDAIERDLESADNDNDANEVDTSGDGETDRQQRFAFATRLAQESSAVREGSAAACLGWAVRAAALAHAATTTKAAYDALLETMQHYEATRQLTASETDAVPPTVDQIKQHYRETILTIVPQNPFEPISELAT